jgi:hypothetical protein
MSEIQENYRLVKVNKELLKISQKKYYEKNKAKIQEWQRQNKREKYANDEEFRKREQERNRLKYQEKKNKKVLENLENLKILEKI